MNDLDLARSIIREEGEAAHLLADELGAGFLRAMETILKAKGRLAVTGMGKSGHIAQKIAATFASTGTPAFFIHPAEASHGDLGMLTPDDVVLVLSKSGESPELSDIVHYSKRFGLPLLAITQEPQSALGSAADCVLPIPRVAEAGPHNLAPTTSTTLSAILGDALAMCCMRRRDFQPQQFKRYHPGGRLGQRLTRAEDIMHSGYLPLATGDTRLLEATVIMSQGLMGCVGIVDAESRLVGIFTDGDLRRQLNRSLADEAIGRIMTPAPQQVAPSTLISEIAGLFSRHKISSVFVCEENRPVGIIHIQDLLRNNFL